METNPLWKKRTTVTEEIAAVIWLGGLFLTVGVCAWLGGGMVRNEMSPWLWIQYPITLRRFGPSDAVFDAVLYAIFYFSAAFLPYAVCRFCLWAAYLNVNDERRVPDVGVIRTVAMALALASGLLFVTFLDAELAFVRHLPAAESALEQWTLITVVIAAPLLIIGSIQVMREELNKVRVVLPIDGHLICRCSRCEHMWASPVSGTSNRCLQLRPIQGTVGGYPIE